MSILKVPDTIQYSITPSQNGVTLCLWETARNSKSQDKSFLFKVNQRVASREEAKRLLRNYLECFKIS